MGHWYTQQIKEEKSKKVSDTEEKRRKMKKKP